MFLLQKQLGLRALQIVATSKTVGAASSYRLLLLQKHLGLRALTDCCYFKNSWGCELFQIFATLDSWDYELSWISCSWKNCSDQSFPGKK
jgi:hypothetical protein